jgi:hypothetical protein
MNNQYYMNSSRIYEEEATPESILGYVNPYNSGKTKCTATFQPLNEQSTKQLHQRREQFPREEGRAKTKDSSA